MPALVPIISGTLDLFPPINPTNLGKPAFGMKVVLVLWCNGTGWNGGGRPNICCRQAGGGRLVVGGCCWGTWERGASRGRAPFSLLYLRLTGIRRRYGRRSRLTRYWLERFGELRGTLWRVSRFFGLATAENWMLGATSDTFNQVEGPALKLVRLVGQVRTQDGPRANVGGRVQEVVTGLAPASSTGVAQ